MSVLQEKTTIVVNGQKTAVYMPQRSISAMANCLRMNKTADVPWQAIQSA